MTIYYDAHQRSLGDVRAGGVQGTTIAYPDDDTAQATDSLGAVRTYHFGSVQGARLLTSIDGPNCRDCLGSAVSYDSNGYPALITGFNADSKRYAYDATGLLQSETEAVGTSAQRTRAYTWDTSLRKPSAATVLGPDGSVVAKRGFVYDAAGRTTARCEVDVSSTSASAYVCSASGVAPAGVRRWVYSYCEAVDDTVCPRVCLLLTADGPRSDVADVTSYAYYMSADESGCASIGGLCHKAGDLLSTTELSGLVTTAVSYDKNGRLTRIRQPNGVLTDDTYTTRGWISTVTVRAVASGQPDAGDATTRLDYDPTGLVHKVTDADGVTTTYGYDAGHRLTDITDALGNRVHYTLDAAGNRTAEKVMAASSAVTRSLGRTFNNLGQLTALVDGLNHTVFAANFADSYDGNGNLVHSQDELSVQQKQVYDGLNRLVSTLKDYNGSNTATANAQTVTSYDAQDRMTGFGDPGGLNTTYDIDGFGNTAGIHRPDTGTTTFGFDIAGHRTSSLDATGVATTSIYDAAGRVTGTTYPDSSLNVQYKYDEDDSVTGCAGSVGKGHLTRVVEGNGGIVYCYDGHGNVVSRKQVLNSDARTVRYTWSPANRLSSVTTGNGTLVPYARNANGQIASVTATPAGGNPTLVASNVAYRPFGPIVSYTLGNGQVITRTYDANDRVTDIDSPAFSLHLARDAMGNAAALGNAPGASPATETYAYDALYRLVAVNDSSGTAVEAYTYSKTGDRLSKAAPGLMTGTYDYQVGTHHLVGVGTTIRQVDARGNTTANVLPSGALGYGYNQRNRMTVVQNNGITVGKYDLNVLGQRVQKAFDGFATRFDYDESGQLLSEDAGASARDYVWLDEVPVGIVDRDAEASSVSLVYVDHSNSPRVVTSASGASRWKWQYISNAFGEKYPTTSSGYSLNMRFPGQYFDVESGLNYNVNRDYEAATGRFVQSDPIGPLAGLQTYTYVWSSPLSRVDPLGLWAPPPIPDPVANFLVGAADDLSFGIGPLLRSEYDIDGGIDPCSTSYKVGGYAALAAGVARLGYAGAAKAIAANPALVGWPPPLHETRSRLSFAADFSATTGHMSTSSFFLSMVLMRPSRRPLREHLLYSIQSVQTPRQARCSIILCVAAKNEDFLSFDIFARQLPSRRGRSLCRSSQFLDRIPYRRWRSIAERTDC